MLQQAMTAFPGPNLDESRSLRLADHLGPGHAATVKPNARLCQGGGRPVQSQTVRFRFAVLTDTGGTWLKMLKRVVVSRIFASWNQLDGWLRQIEGLRRAA